MRLDVILGMYDFAAAAVNRVNGIERDRFVVTWGSRKQCDINS
jgi:hypothetical protein